MGRPKRTAMLFLPPHPPLPIREEGSVVLGRSQSCDLTLDTPDASRRHAEIVAAGAGYVIRDLDSTNGTFVNSQRIREHRLEPGDRIGIGRQVIVFCQVDAGLEGGGASERDNAQTMVVLDPIPAECFRGDLREIPPFAVLQTLEMGRKTGLLRVDSGLGPGRLWLGEGTPIHAETRPPGTHAGWSLLLMVGVCWWACQSEDKRLHLSRTWALGCRTCAVLGMLAGMAVVHSALAAAMPGDAAAGIALSHVAMVSAMAIGSSVGFAVPLWLNPDRP